MNLCLANHTAHKLSAHFRGGVRTETASLHTTESVNLEILVFALRSV